MLNIGDIVQCKEFVFAVKGDHGGNSDFTKVDATVIKKSLMPPIVNGGGESSLRIDKSRAKAKYVVEDLYCHDPHCSADCYARRLDDDNQYSPNGELIKFNWGKPHLRVVGKLTRTFI